jgi:hypothetical protein
MKRVENIFIKKNSSVAAVFVSIGKFVMFYIRLKEQYQEIGVGCK